MTLLSVACDGANPEHEGFRLLLVQGQAPMALARSPARGSHPVETPMRFTSLAIAITCAENIYKRHTTLLRLSASRRYVVSCRLDAARFIGGHD
ncbi:hypothetical protein NL676_008803 [Syzygium grande]|nr:hypothetical protein NL676_008803 [Syzygium grande]